ncbi:RagB/SusD family nutrient uptake outer membrane protein, partial [Spirosoma pomorum]
MIQKVKIISLALLATSLSITGCNDNFVNTQPLDQVAGDAVWTDAALAEAFVTGIYAGLGQGGFNEQQLASLTDETIFTHPGRGITTITEARSNPADAGWINETIDWNQMYLRIRAANLAIQNLATPKFANSSGMADRLMGEAKFMRAYYYHQLVRYYGGVPIVDKVYGLGEADYATTRNTM